MTRAVWNTLSRLFLVLSLLLLMAIGINGMLSDLWLFRVDPIFSMVPRLIQPGEDWTRRLPYVALFLFPVCSILCWIASRGGQKVYELATTDKQTIRIAQKAIHQFVKNVISEVRSVKDHSVHVRQRGGQGLEMTVTVNLKPVRNIPGVQKSIEELIRRRMTELLNIEKIHSINVVIGDFGAKSGATGSAADDSVSAERPDFWAGGVSASSSKESLSLPGHPDDADEVMDDDENEDDSPTIRLSRPAQPERVDFGKTDEDPDRDS